ncbi:MAG: hypothetical protein WBA88_14390, partial [Pseudaminobacter sp.]
MVKTPKMRHSKSHREPVTIELEPEAVSRVPDGDSSASDDPAAQAAIDQAESPTSSDAATSEAGSSPSQTQAKDQADREPSSYDFSSAEGSSSATHDQNTASAGEPAPARPETRQGGLGLVAAGIVGGVIALAGAGALQFAGILPAANSSGASQVPDSVQAELAQLKQAVAGLENGAGGTDTELAGRVDALAQTVDQLKSDTASLREAQEASGAGENGDDLQALETRLNEAEASIAALRQQGSEQPAADDVAAIDEKLAGLEALVGTADETVKNTAERLGTLE